MFRVNIVKDTVGVELCGALKNIVAIGAGFCDGLEYGGNTKAAIIRIGLLEMKKFCNTVQSSFYCTASQCGTKMILPIAVSGTSDAPLTLCFVLLFVIQYLSQQFYDGIADETFFESCGIADLITTCFGGRNRKCAEAYARLPNPTATDWDKIEADILNGQKLQGTLTAKEVHEVLERTGKVRDFPFFTQVYNIAYGGLPVTKIVEFEQVKCRL
jgi:glycerol-3-phosphate dehydrogenase (NAD+)